MGLEVFGFIKDLVSSNPDGRDPKSEGDDHLRGIKQTLQNQFPGFTEGAPITVSESAINGIPSMRTVPPGLICAWPGGLAIVPPGFKYCDGSTLSRTGFAALFAVIGESYGAGDGATTFALPDYRGYFLRAQGINSDGVTRAGVVGSKQADELKSHTHTATSQGPPAHGQPFGGAFSGPGETGATGGEETRPHNIAVHYIIAT